MRRCQQFERRFPFVLKADVRKFFPSVDHQILKQLIRQKVRDPDVLWLCDLIIDHSNPPEPVLDWFPGDDLLTPSERRLGFPLGNQTSQFFANVFLDPLDHFIKERLRAKGYVRYVDDFLVFAETKEQLRDWQRQIAEFLATKLRLRVRPTKNVIFPTRCGIPFLGYRVFPTHRLLAKSNLRRFRKRVKRLQKLLAEGRITWKEVRQRLMSWSGHARQADTHRLRQRLFREFTWKRTPADKPDDPAGPLRP